MRLGQVFGAAWHKRLSCVFARVLRESDCVLGAEMVSAGAAVISNAKTLAIEHVKGVTIPPEGVAHFTTRGYTTNLPGKSRQ